MATFTIAIFVSLAVSSSFGFNIPSLRDVSSAVSSNLGFRNPSIPERDHWYKIPKDARFTDLPRIFDYNSACPAEFFYLDCNRCNCPAGSTKGACTRMGCDPIPQIINFEVTKLCPAGRPFYWKCNDCVCDESGIDADCTRKACLAPKGE